MVEARRCDLCDGPVPEVQELQEVGGTGTIKVCEDCAAHRSRALVTGPNPQLEAQLRRLAEAHDEPLWEGPDARYLFPEEELEGVVDREG